MDHPFFDTISYPWTRKDAQTLHSVLAQAEKDSGRIQLIYDQCIAGPPLTLPAAADKLWREVLNNLAAGGALKLLCDSVKDKFSKNKKIVDAIIAVEAAKPASEIQFFSKEIFILDCKPHREAISKSTSQTNAKALLVRGNPKSGKSHCRFILQSIADEKEVPMLYLYDGIITTVEESIESIFSTLGFSKKNIPPKVTTDDAWYRAICNKLKELATTSGRKIWIVVDDLGYIEGKPESGPILDKKIRLFFEQFVLFMLDPSFAKFFRLLLINYSEPNVPTKWKNQMWTEVKADENSVQQNDVESFLKEWALFNEVNIIEGELIAVAAEVIQKAEVPPPEIAQLPRLERIHTILSVKLEEILRRAS